MNCKQIHNDLIFFLDGELSAERMEFIQNHLDDCAACRSFLEEMKLQLQIIDNEKSPEISPWFEARLMARLHATTSKSAPVSSPNEWIRSLAFTSLLLAGIISGIYFGDKVSGPSVNRAESPDWMLMNDFKAEPIETFLLGE